MRLLTVKYFPLWLLLTLSAAAMAFGAKPTARPTDDDRARAAYLFMEAASHIANHEYGPAYYMLSRAAELDPTDDEIGSQLGILITWASLGDSADVEKGYRALKRLFFSNPSDAQNGVTFINTAQQMGRADDMKEAFLALMNSHPGNADYALEYAGLRTLDYLRGDSTGPAEATAIYDRLEQGVGITDILTLHRLHTLSVVGDTTGIITQINRFNATSPLNAEVNFLSGKMFDMVKMPDSAIVYYTKACELDSTYGQAYLARAEHFLAVGDSANYDIEVIHALESPSLEFDVKYEILSNYTRTLYSDEDRRPIFAGLFRKMLDMHPGEPTLHYLYGSYLGTIDSIAAAAEQFGYAVDLDPEEEVFLRYRFQTALASGDTVGAIEASRLGIQRFNDIFYPLSGASLLHLNGKYDEAVDLLKGYGIDRAENDYQKSLYESTLGDILYAAGQKDSAFTAYDRALAYNPDNSSVLNNMAYFMAVDGIDLQKAEKYIRHALMFDANNPTFIDTYAWVLFKQKDYPAARRQIDRALNAYNTPVSDIDTSASELSDIVASDDLTEMLTGVTDGEQIQRENAQDKAIADEIDQSMETPGSEIYDHAGDIYFMNGEPERALYFWKEALALDPTNEKIRKKVDHRTYFFE